MFKRRFMLRLAVAVITFLIGWGVAVLSGTSRTGRFFARHTHARAVFVPFNASPEFDHAPCGGSYRMQHAFERHELRDDGRGLDFDALPPPPPAPIVPR